MAASVTVLWLVSALLGGAFSLNCYHCNTTGNNCDDNEKLCEGKHDTCITTLIDSRQDKAPQKSSKQLVKSCGEKKFCNQTYSMTFNSTRIVIATTCCDTDKCKTILPDVKLQEKEKENSHKCPYCNESVAKCSDTDKVSCFGEEQKCVSFTVTEASNPMKTYGLKGCATNNMCPNNIVASLIANQGIVESSFQCNHAPSLLPGLLLPAAFALALLKLLL